MAVGGRARASSLAGRLESLTHLQNTMPTPPLRGGFLIIVFLCSLSLLRAWAPLPCARGHGQAGRGDCGERAQGQADPCSQGLNCYNQKRKGKRGGHEQRDSSVGINLRVSPLLRPALAGRDPTAGGIEAHLGQ